MPTLAEADDSQRQKHIPHLFVRGTHYEVGFSIGKSFRGLIEDFFEDYKDFTVTTLPAYESEEGREIYNECISLCRKRFPLYVQELEGLAAGSKIPFHHLFLLHIEDLIVPHEPKDNGENEADIINANCDARAPDLGCNGCTTIISNVKPHSVLLGHTEDALKEMTNNFYIVSVEALSADGTLLEKFTSLAYPGQLPGGTMGFNDSGIIHSINSIFPVTTFPRRTPHLFLTRAALGAQSLNQLIEILRDEGSGAANAFSMNLIVVGADPGASEMAYNIEVCSNMKGKLESDINVTEISKGDCYSHSNSLLHCSCPEKPWFVSSSVVRQEIIKGFAQPYDFDRMKEILSNEVPNVDDKVKYSIFKRAMRPDDLFATIVAGIFHVSRKQWYLYKHPPSSSQPTAVIPMSFNRSL